MGVANRADPPGVVGPVRYLTNANEYVAGDAFEAATMAFLTNAGHMYGRDAAESSALRAQLKSLAAELHDPEIAEWRRLEARLGYDPDEAPSDLMASLFSQAELYGQGSIDEAAAACPGAEALDVLRRGIEIVQTSPIVCDLQSVLRAREADAVAIEDVHWGRLRAAGGRRLVADTVESFELARPHPDPLGTDLKTPWALAELAAQQCRASLRLKSGPILNKRFADILGTSQDVFKSVSPDGTTKALPYGLRLSEGDNAAQRVVLCSRWPHDRRFELARVLGDTFPQRVLCSVLT